MYWIAGAALNRLNAARNPQKNMAAKHIQRCAGERGLSLMPNDCVFMLCLFR